MEDFDRIEYYTRIIDELSSKNDDNEELFWAYIERGIAYFNNVEYDLAARDFEAAIDINPDEAVSYYNLGIIAKQRNNFDRAVDYFKKVIELDVNNNNAYYELGLVMNEIKNYESALDYFSKAISYGRKTADVFYNRAISFVALNRLDEALKSINAAIKLKQSNPLYYIVRSNIYLSNHNYFNSIADLTSAIRLKPEFPSYRFNRAITYATVASCIKFSTDSSNSILIEKAREISNDFKGENFNLYYTLAEYDINKAIDKEVSLYRNPENITPSYYLTRGAIYLSWGKEIDAVYNFVMAKRSIKMLDREISDDLRSEYLPSKFYLMKALIHLYLDDYDEAKKNLDVMLNNDAMSERLDLLYACYWWSREKDFEKTNFWFQRAFKKGFDIYNLVDDLFEGRFLRSFFFELEKRNLINF
ncbi:MAG: tetratricopeptide repeat protein [Elusimicrobia bacterium]|nr:tetratricopeptide repeat protein [Elusimicrobiota bacterium]